MKRKLKYMLNPADGWALWLASRDGWQVKLAAPYGFSLRVVAKEYHDATTPLPQLGLVTCRVCGEKIPKGEPRFVLIGDPGDNLWTAHKWHVHAKPCVPEETL